MAFFSLLLLFSFQAWNDWCQWPSFYFCYFENHSLSTPHKKKICIHIKKAYYHLVLIILLKWYCHTAKADGVALCNFAPRLPSISLTASPAHLPPSKMPHFQQHAKTMLQLILQLITHQKATDACMCCSTTKQTNKQIHEQMLTGLELEIL